MLRLLRFWCVVSEVLRDNLVNQHLVVDHHRRQRVLLPGEAWWLQNPQGCQLLKHFRDETDVTTKPLSQFGAGDRLSFVPQIDESAQEQTRLCDDSRVLLGHKARVRAQMRL